MVPAHVRFAVTAIVLFVLTVSVVAFVIDPVPSIVAPDVVLSVIAPVPLSVPLRVKFPRWSRVKVDTLRVGPEFTVKALVTIVFEPNVLVPPPEIVRLLNVVAVEGNAWAPAPLKFTVPVPAVNVPAPDQSPPTVRVDV